MPGMGAAAGLIAQAVRDRKKITLYGDYDVDGITGTAMLWHTLKAAGANVETYIPHRVDEGYGLNADAVSTLVNGGTQLLVTIDCGVSAIAPITLARKLGADVVVSDHHEFAGDGQMPPANAIVHPRLTVDGQTYPNPDLCGAGVAFKLAWAVAQQLCNAGRVNEVYRALLLEFTALAALGTVADVVPLTGENRIIVKYGLEQLPRTKLAGLRAFIKAAGYEEGAKIDATGVGFTLGPRLNAAGRMGHAREAVELLTSAEGARADEIATYLESQNRLRQTTEKRMFETALKTLDWPEDAAEQKARYEALPPILVVAHESFHAGVVGIVASRLVEKFNRPTFVLAKNGHEAHGSARSVNGFELHQAIEAARDLLITGGGHAMAGGVKLSMEQLEAFTQRLHAFGGQHLTAEHLTPLLEVDAVIDLPDACKALCQYIEKLAPFGRGNPSPRFVLQGVKIAAPPRRVGAAGSHLQLNFSQNRSFARGIAFKMGVLEPHLPVGSELHVVTEVKLDSWNGQERVDLVLQDVARATGEAFDI